MKKRTMWMISALILTFAQPVLAEVTGELKLSEMDGRGAHCGQLEGKKKIQSADSTQDKAKKIEAVTAASAT